MRATTSIRSLLLAGALLPIAVTQPAHALGLLEAYEAAVQNDPVYRAAQRENDAGQQYRALGRSSLLPTVAATYGRNRNAADVTTTTPAGETTDPRRYNSLAASLQVRQPLFHPEGLARWRQGEAQANASTAQLAQRSQELVVRVVALYTAAKYAEDQLALAVAQREAYAAQRVTNQRLFQRGEGTRTEVLETQARFDLSVAQVLEAQDNQVNARSALSAAVGQEVTVLDPLVEDFRVKPSAPMSFEEWKTIALTSNAELQLQRLGVEIAREETNKSRAGHMPRLDLVASAGKNNSDTVNTFNQNTNLRTVGLQLNVPIYSGGAVTAATAQAQANQEKAEAELAAKTAEVLIELRKQYNVGGSGLTRLQAAQSALDSANLALEATQKSVAGGQRTNLDVLQAQQRLFDARRELALSRYNHLLGTLRLRLAAGTLHPSDLAEVASYFRSAARPASR